MRRMTRAKFMVEMMPTYGLPHAFYDGEAYAS
jgi:hypothetical protein